MEIFRTLLVPPEAPFLAIITMRPLSTSTAITLRLSAESGEWLEVLGAIWETEGTNASLSFGTLRVALC